MKESKKALIDLGFPEFCIEDFHDLVMEYVEPIYNKKMSIEQLEKAFLDQTVSDYIVSYMRFLCSGYLRQNEENYLPFLIDYGGIDDFCKRG